MTVITKVGFDPLTERELYSLSIDRLDEIPESINLSSEHFACFIAWDSESTSVDEISKLVEVLIKNGGAYFCSWGNDCQRVHDIIDGIDAYPYNNIGSPEDSVIMTSWHENESIDEALYYFLTFTSPDEFYESSMNSSLAISIGSKEWSNVIDSALMNPTIFRENIEAKEVD